MKYKIELCKGIVCVWIEGIVQIGDMILFGEKEVGMFQIVSGDCVIVYLCFDCVSDEMIVGQVWVWLDY